MKHVESSWGHLEDIWGTFWGPLGLLGVWKTHFEGDTFARWGGLFLRLRVWARKLAGRPPQYAWTGTKKEAKRARRGQSNAKPNLENPPNDDHLNGKSRF